jgi:hypothetical protein
MIEKARKCRKTGAENVEFRLGEIRHLPWKIPPSM